jgi:hypothetical protein
MHPFEVRLPPPPLGRTGLVPSLGEWTGGVLPKPPLSFAIVLLLLRRLANYFFSAFFFISSLRSIFFSSRLLSLATIAPFDSGLCDGEYLRRSLASCQAQFVK